MLYVSATPNAARGTRCMILWNSQWVSGFQTSEIFHVIMNLRIAISDSTSRQVGVWCIFTQFIGLCWLSNKYTVPL